MNILFLGPQGSGKGTQAKRLSAAQGVPHIATGDMLREAMSAETPLGLQVKPIYDRGALVPDEIMIALIRERLVQPDAAGGFVLDGFPRTVAQAAALDEMLAAIDRPLDAVFLFDLPDDVATRRMLRRADEEQRTDDTPDAIKRRLDNYHEHTAPVVERYRSAGTLVSLHAERSIDEVWSEIDAALVGLAAGAGG
jgi:adenylate kinase